MAHIHESKVGTHHPAPGVEIAWTINDTRGYLDTAPACDECGACDCVQCDEHTCAGLSFAYVCLDGGDTLCEDCAEKAGITVEPCDCE